jgi:hypothetical protein
MEPWHYKYSSAIDYYTNERGLLKIVPIAIGIVILNPRFNRGGTVSHNLSRPLSGSDPIIISVNDKDFRWEHIAPVRRSLSSTTALVKNYMSVFTFFVKGCFGTFTTYF